MARALEDRNNFDSPKPWFVLDEQRRELLYFSLRVTFLIVFPAPSLFVLMTVGCLFQIAVTLITSDPDYYSQHRWCVGLCALLSGHLLWKLRKTPFFEFGGVFGQILLVGGMNEILR